MFIYLPYGRVRSFIFKSSPIWMGTLIILLRHLTEAFPYYTNLLYITPSLQNINVPYISWCIDSRAITLTLIVFIEMFVSEEKRKWLLGSRHRAIDTHPCASDTDPSSPLSSPCEPWIPRITQDYPMYNGRVITLLNDYLRLDIFHKRLIDMFYKEKRLQAVNA